MFFRKHIRLLIACLLGASTGTMDLISSDEARNVIILANSADPNSLKIADYYSEKRGIPPENIIALPMPKEETISVRQYVETLHNPLLNTLIDKQRVRVVKSNRPDFIGRERISVGLHRINYLVTVRGVPLRIANDPELLDSCLSGISDPFKVSNASVDSELALLIGPADLSMTAFVLNPLFANATSTTVKPERVIRVSRLDGPSVSAVKRMIDRTLKAETKGLAGRAYFDIGGPYALADEWIRSAGKLAEEAFFDTDYETTNRVMDESDRFDTPAIYMGWYRQHAYGPWIKPRWSVPPGAIGFHLHSFSATTMRSVSEGWLGAFVNQGYCAAVGNVYEPYLEYTHRPDILLKSLLRGNSFGEAVMLSNPVLSWQGVAIGDPLYRPFRVDLATQLENADDLALNPYVYLREINRLEARGKSDQSFLFAQARYQEEPSLPMADKLARLYAQRGEIKQAVKTLKMGCSADVFAQDEVMLAKELADLMSEFGEHKHALSVYKKLIRKKDLTILQQIPLLEDGAKLALKAGESQLSLEWTTRARSLNTTL